MKITGRFKKGVVDRYCWFVACAASGLLTVVVVVVQGMCY